MMHERGKSDPNIDTMGQSAARCGTIGAPETHPIGVAPCVKRTI
jgi:hypothetical protein